jgi:hypothetical protein
MAWEPDSALLPELVEAHLDTIEVMLEAPEVDRDDRGHVQYLQALVHEAKAQMARPLPPSAPSMSWL